MKINSVFSAGSNNKNFGTNRIKLDQKTYYAVSDEAIEAMRLFLLRVRDFYKKENVSINGLKNLGQESVAMAKKYPYRVWDFFVDTLAQSAINLKKGKRVLNPEPIAHFTQRRGSDISEQIVYSDGVVVKTGFIGYDIKLPREYEPDLLIGYGDVNVSNIEEAYPVALMTLADHHAKKAESMWYVAFNAAKNAVEKAKKAATLTFMPGKSAARIVSQDANNDIYIAENKAQKLIKKALLQQKIADETAQKANFTLDELKKQAIDVA